MSSGVQHDGSAIGVECIVPLLRAGFRFDGFPVLLCWDRPFDEWPLDGDGHIEARFGDLDLEDLLREPPPEG